MSSQDTPSIQGEDVKGNLVGAGANGVALCNINPGYVAGVFVESLVSLLAGPDRKYLKQIAFKNAGSLVHFHRNEVTQWALEHEGWEWLLWIDSDMKFPNNLISLLLDAAHPTARPIISGDYIHPLQDRHVHSLFRYEFTSDALHMVPIPNEQVTSWKDQGNKLYRVDGTGAGCLFIHRSVLDHMKAAYGRVNPWFDTDVPYNIPFGEDFTFCARAAKLGYPIFVRLDIGLGHLKESLLTT